tara:strand:+ start:1499 stop:1666 length:168 start_codon:yes stop_codon:yes gene_type:complete
LTSFARCGIGERGAKLVRGAFGAERAKGALDERPRKTTFDTDFTFGACGAEGAGR